MGQTLVVKLVPTVVPASGVLMMSSILASWVGVLGVGVCDVEVEVLRPEEGETNLEWQAGVFRAERPAVRAMWSRGRWGRLYMLWCVSRKRWAR
jgi:hypothetical protein